MSDASFDPRLPGPSRPAADAAAHAHAHAPARAGDLAEDAADGAELIACPRCDALYRARPAAPGQRVSCARCHKVLIAPRQGAFGRLIAMAVTVVILMTGATFFPFLQISVSGMRNSASVFDAVLAFVDGPMAVLSLAVAALIVVIPLLRALLVIYVVTPLALGRPPLPSARRAFRVSEDLRPWSMSEIFVIGCAVALIKVADLAKVGYGPAFWMFAAMVLVVMFQDGFMCRWTIWKTLDDTRRRS